MGGDPRWGQKLVGKGEPACGCLDDYEHTCHSFIFAVVVLFLVGFCNVVTYQEQSPDGCHHTPFFLFSRDFYSPAHARNDLERQLMWRGGTHPSILVSHSCSDWRIQCKHVIYLFFLQKKREKKPSLQFYLKMANGPDQRWADRDAV